MPKYVITLHSIYSIDCGIIRIILVCGVLRCFAVFAHHANIRKPLPGQGAHHSWDLGLPRVPSPRKVASYGERNGKNAELHHRSTP